MHCREEVEEFQRLAAALVINVGTLTPAWVESMHLAAKAASALGHPWVLDPVGSWRHSVQDAGTAQQASARHNSRLTPLHQTASPLTLPA